MKSPNISEEFVAQKRKEVGSRLKSIREERGLSLQEVGEIVGLGAYNVNKVENGTWNVNLSLLILFSEALDFELEFSLK